MKKILGLGIVLAGLVLLGMSAQAASFGWKKKAKVKKIKDVKVLSVTGVINSLDKNVLKVMTVPKKAVKKKGKKKVLVYVFVMDKLTQMKRADLKKASLEDLVPGKPVKVEYTKHKSKKTARVIFLLPEPEKPKDVEE